ncbi:AraC family transcriptional regulator [Gordonia sinesedis]
MDTTLWAYPRVIFSRGDTSLFRWGHREGVWAQLDRQWTLSRHDERGRGVKPLARYATLGDYVDVARGCGIDPAILLREVGLDPAGVGVPDRWAPAEEIAALLERSAQAAGRDDFGLALAHRRRFSGLGPLSLVIREEPDVRSALRVLIRHQDMYNEALHTSVVESGGIATVRLALDVGRPDRCRQATELGVGVLYHLVQGFIAPGWRPLGAFFAHAAPADVRPHHRLFGAQVDFGAGGNGISMYSTDLDLPNVMADPDLRRYAHKMLADVDMSTNPTVTQRVRELIELLLPTGRCSVDQVARSLGVDRRTVHRQLAAEGETYTALLHAVRADLATHLVVGRRYTMTEIADLLGFASPGNFSRWFRELHGRTPSAYRGS